MLLYALSCVVKIPHFRSVLLISVVFLGIKLRNKYAVTIRMNNYICSQ